VREWVDAFRGEGLRVGLYFSLIDWHHPDYPAFTDDYRPYNFARLPRPTPEQWERYLAFMFGQVRELLTSYGRIDLIWFDGQWEHTPQEWRAAELAAMIRDLQPGIVINDRLPGGDYDTAEQFVPAVPPSRPWEVCLTMNESWGYNPDDPDYKSSRRLVQTLCEIAGKGGRLLLNLSPRGDGALPPEQLERLLAVGEWMRRNDESITGSRPGLEPWQFYGPSTQKDGTQYLHLLMRPYDAVTVRGVPIRRVKSVRELSSGRQLAFSGRCSVIDQLLNADPMGELTIVVPESVLDPLATVLAVEIAPCGG
jgi:alpha-L-fucosidase